MHLKRVIKSAPASPCQRVSHPHTKRSKAPHPTRLGPKTYPTQPEAVSPQISQISAPVGSLTSTACHVQARPHTQQIHVLNTPTSDQQMPWKPTPSNSGGPFHIPGEYFSGQPFLVLVAFYPCLRGCLDIAANSGQETKKKLAEFARSASQTNALSYSAPSPAASGIRNWTTTK